MRGTTLRALLPPLLAAAVAADFPGEPRVLQWVAELLAGGRYRRPFALALLAAARGEGGDSWEARCLAALMLQHQVLRVPARSWEEQRIMLRALGLPSDPKEGFSSAEPRRLFAELRRKLARAERVLQRLRGRRTSLAAWRGLVALSRQECKLALARYLFTPAEVVARVRRLARASRGVPDLSWLDDEVVAAEAERSLGSLPRYEAEVLAGLQEPPCIHWVAPGVGGELNALVEYPLTTVVLVVKPPGSCLEIELKRAGRRGPHPLSATYERDGEPVPLSHRLDGGSLTRCLNFDAAGTHRFAHLYRAVHGREAPLSRTHAVASILTVPTPAGEVPLLDYLTRPEVFGAGFAEMRAAMAEAVAAFSDERDTSLPPLAGPLGLTVQFLSFTAPAQAVLSGTTSFRLDRLALYLSPEGPEAYGGPGVEREDGRRLAEDVLEEVLGECSPPAGRYRDHGRLVDAAFAVPANRARADACFAAALEEIGRVWGTLLALRGSSRGESFVARNVGLRGTWRDGRWTVGITFMDHDDLCFAPRRFEPLSALPDMLLDERHVLRSVAALESIYRVDRAGAEAGRAGLRRQMALAYARTRESITTDPGLRPLFSPTFLRRLNDWDDAARELLAAPEGWEERARRLLAGRGYGAARVTEHLEALKLATGFLERTRCLYEGATRV